MFEGKQGNNRNIRFLLEIYIPLKLASRRNICSNNISCARALANLLLRLPFRIRKAVKRNLVQVHRHFLFGDYSANGSNPIRASFISRCGAAIDRCRHLTTVYATHDYYSTVHNKKNICNI